MNADSADDAVENLPPLRSIIADHQLSARKHLGQNFLLDLNLTRRIARAAGPLEQGTIVEIGPGPGGLTRGLLLEGAQRLVAVEKDARAVAALETLTVAAGSRLTVHLADASRVNLADLGPAPIRIAANLPYNIATQLLIGWLHHLDHIASMTLMFQREVADRLVAAPGSAAYGRLSVLVGWLTKAEKLFDLPASAFTPPPKVTSTVVRLIPRAQPLAAANRATLERLTAAAFGQRRKMLRASLRSLGGADMLTAAGINPQARPEELSIEDFCRIAQTLDGQAPG
ncbi:MAG: 16S rRNA (adenine(1518)-N(6)/adenine(1519)-N(6))-dimethyltransferase [Nisaea sp.]|nr:16S rRNA (adenine(1518)-N(6)/adenine(1519)-N(6))-dimethyltransferase [Nisaea sp.]OUX95889.1 MAG: 16S rRNA (adenine(1518)-N(6)/adenine(1519)-N(6))-dimethyltransferase [Candidatus Endolissoclinum sp. TMED26]